MLLTEFCPSGYESFNNLLGYFTAMHQSPRTPAWALHWHSDNQRTQRLLAQRQFQIYSHHAGVATRTFTSPFGAVVEILGQEWL